MSSLGGSAGTGELCIDTVSPAPFMLPEAGDAPPSAGVDKAIEYSPLHPRMQAFSQTDAAE